MSRSLEDFAEFLMGFDQLKLVNRRSYISGGERLENSAEHSWHLAMACWAFAEWFDLDVNQEMYPNVTAGFYH